MSATEHVPSPADASRQTAEEFLSEVAAEDGRVFRMTEPPRVFVVTTNEQLAVRLMRQGAKPFLPAHLDPSDLAPKSAYRKNRAGTWEWDLEVAGLPLIEGDMWTAAGAFKNGRLK